MAEGWAKEILGDRWEVKSAGIEAHGVNPQAIQAMQDIGIDISQQTSDRIDRNTLDRATYVVTLCGDALDHCPTIPFHVKQEHWGFSDPATAEGSASEVWQVFQQVRDAIGERIKRFAEEQRH